MGGDTGNTRNSHRLLAWAADEHGLDKQNQLAEALFNGYFCKVH
jgi:predicted DsbA family dithiol-disulfide isomerase